jgi:RsbT co-antagonist protein rsbRD N-terminal domain
MSTTQSLRDVIARDEGELLAEWLRHQMSATTLRRDLINDTDLRDQSKRFLAVLKNALGATSTPQDPSGVMCVRS